MKYLRLTLIFTRKRAPIETYVKPLCVWDSDLMTTFFQNPNFSLMQQSTYLLTKSSHSFKRRRRSMNEISLQIRFFIARLTAKSSKRWPHGSYPLWPSSFSSSCIPLKIAGKWHRQLSIAAAGVQSSSRRRQWRRRQCQPSTLRRSPVCSPAPASSF